MIRNFWRPLFFVLFLGQAQLYAAPSLCSALDEIGPDAVVGPVSQANLAATIDASAGKRAYSFIKDVPIVGYQITSDRFEDIPLAIRKYIGGVDNTKYTSDFLRKNIGSFIALQMKDDKTPDFYIVELLTRKAKYQDVTFKDVQTKNAKLVGRLENVIPLSRLMTRNPNIVALLKTAPVGMVRMSELGYHLGEAVSIESPWGQQTKPAGQDAFLTKNEEGKWYMVNTDAQGDPIGYVAAPKNVGESAMR